MIPGASSAKRKMHTRVKGLVPCGVEGEEPSWGSGRSPAIAVSRDKRIAVDEHDVGGVARRELEVVERIPKHTGDGCEV
jgi:hypothetical protein